MKKRIIIDIILNVIIVLSVSIGMSIHIALSAGSGPLDGGGIYTFRYFTNLSNVFCGIIALWIVIHEIGMLKKGEEELPAYLMTLRQLAATVVGVTFATVNFIFLPLVFKDAYNTLYGGQKIMTHVTTPLLSMISFVFLAKGKVFNWKTNFFAMIPEFLYGMVYELEVPILGNWSDFYGFTLGGKWYAPFIVLPVICGMGYGISILLSFLHHKIQKN